MPEYEVSWKELSSQSIGPDGRKTNSFRRMVTRITAKNKADAYALLLTHVLRADAQEITAPQGIRTPIKRF